MENQNSQNRLLKNPIILLEPKKALFKSLSSGPAWAPQ
jgi:hypothetical protein